MIKIYELLKDYVYQDDTCCSAAESHDDHRLTPNDNVKLVTESDYEKLKQQLAESKAENDRLRAKIAELNGLPFELICLSCLTTQKTSRLISNGNACVICDNPIDPYNLRNIEV